MNIDQMKVELNKIREENEFKAAVSAVYARPKNHYNKLTASTKKAKHQSPGSLDMFKEENSHYTDKQVNEWVRGTEMYENYTHSNNNCDWD